MSAIVILLIGMAVVIGGILAFRLHAFLALLLAALVVAGLTRGEQIRDTSMRAAAIPVLEAGEGSIRVDADRRKYIAGLTLAFRPSNLSEPVAQLQLGELTAAGWVPVISDQNGEPLEAGDLLLHHTQLATAQSSGEQNLAERVADGFGNTCTKLGIIVALAAIIGKCLLDSGAASRIVSSARRILGERLTPVAFAVSGFIVGIPVFFDTVFYLLMPLGKAMRIRTGKNYLLYILAIVMGATMAHSLVPPTPGPLLVSEQLGVQLGMMMVAGIVVGIVSIAFGFVYALVVNHIWEIPLRATADQTEADLKALAEEDERANPPLWLSLLPILLPVGLLAADTTVEMAIAATDPAPQWAASLQPITSIVGNKNIALLLAAAIAIVTASRKTGDISLLSGGIGQALQSAGVIILITAAGGAFGQALRQTGIAHELKQWFQVSEATLTLLLVAFGLTALVRVAQGSATVAMITGVSIIAPLAESMALPYHPVYLALAIGCGSKPGPWMNDSGFWIVGKMSGMTEGETLKTFSVMLTVMGVAGLGATLLGARYLPMVQP